MALACNSVVSLPTNNIEKYNCGCGVKYHQWAMVLRLPSGAIVELRTSVKLGTNDIFDMIEQLEDVTEE